MKYDRVLFLVFCILVSIGMLACSELSTPADLDREQILAVRATPPGLVPGGSVVLEPLLAGPNGRFLSTTDWEIAGDDSQLQLETLETGGLRIRADDAYPLENDVEVELRVALSDGYALRARKRVVVSQAMRSNPVIDALRVAGTPVDNNGVAVLQEDIVELAVEAPEGASIAWYTSIGEIRYYRDATTTLELTEKGPSEGWLAVVVRDGEGGANWHTCTLRRP